MPLSNNGSADDRGHLTSAGSIPPTTRALLGARAFGWRVILEPSRDCPLGQG